MVVVVVVVVEVVVVDGLVRATVVWPPVPPLPAPAVPMVVEGATAEMETLWVAVAEVYTSVPGCEAEITHVPTAENVTTPAVSEQIEAALVIVSVGARPASLVTFGV